MRKGKMTRWCICTFLKMVKYWIWHRLLSRMQSASKKGRKNMSKDKKNKKEKDNNNKKNQLFKNKNLPQLCADHWNGSKLTRSKLLLPPRGIKQKQTEFMVEKILFRSASADLYPPLFEHVQLRQKTNAGLREIHPPPQASLNVRVLLPHNEIKHQK